MANVSDLGRLVKAKYPGSYDDLPDDALGLKIQSRFPGAYDDFAAMPPTITDGQQAPPEPPPGMMSSHGANALPREWHGQPTVPPMVFQPPVPKGPVIEGPLLDLGGMVEQKLGPTALPAEPVRPGVPLYPGRPVGQGPVTTSPPAQMLASAPLRGIAEGAGQMTSPEGLAMLGQAVAVPPLGYLMAADALGGGAAQAGQALGSAIGGDTGGTEEAVKGLASLAAQAALPVAAAHARGAVRGVRAATDFSPLQMGLKDAFKEALHEWQAEQAGQIQPSHGARPDIPEVFGEGQGPTPYSGGMTPADLAAAIRGGRTFSPREAAVQTGLPVREAANVLRRAQQEAMVPEGQDVVGEARPVPQPSEPAAPPPPPEPVQTRNSTTREWRIAQRLAAGEDVTVPQIRQEFGVGRRVAEETLTRAQELAGQGREMAARGQEPPPAPEPVQAAPEPPPVAPPPPEAPQPPPEAAPAPSVEAVPERRSDIATRKRVADMTPDERAVALHTDELTGLQNRRSWDDAEQSGTLGAAKTRIDLDNFKAINDQFGHDSGDVALRAVGEAARAAGVDLYRIGGDEFALHAPDEAAAADAVSRLRAKLADAEVEFTSPDGGIHSYKGVDFSHGTGDSLQAADVAAAANKAERTAAGLRSGERDTLSPQLRRVPVEPPAGVEADRGAVPEQGPAVPANEPEPRGGSRAGVEERPSLGNTPQEVYAAWEKLGQGHSGQVVEGVVPLVGKFSWRNGKIVRDFHDKGRTGYVSTYREATQSELAEIQSAIQDGRFQVQTVGRYGAGGMRDYIDAGVLQRVHHQATGTPLGDTATRAVEIPPAPAPEPKWKATGRKAREKKAVEPSHEPVDQVTATPEQLSAAGDEVRANIARRVADAEARKRAEPPAEPPVVGAPPVKAKSVGAGGGGEEFPQTGLLDRTRAAAMAARAAFRGPAETRSTFTRVVDSIKRNLTSGDLPTVTREAPDAANILKSLASANTAARLWAMDLRDRVSNIYKGHGIEDGFERFVSTISDVNLEDTRRFWNEKKAEIDGMSPEEVVGRFADDYARLTGALAGTSKWKRNRTLKELSRAVAAEDAAGVKEALSDIFGRAAENVGKIVGPEGRRGLENANDPAFREARALYEAEFEKPLREMHTLAGHETRDIRFEGEPFPWYPLQSTGKGMSRFERIAWKKPESGHAKFRTGQGTDYDLSIGPLMKTVANDIIRKNGIDAAMQKLTEAGWLRPDEGSMPRQPGETYLDMNPRGEMEKYVSRKISMEKIGKDGKLIPARWASMPEWMAKELDPFLQPFQEAQNFVAASAKAIGKATTEVNLGGPTDAAFHTHNQLGGIVARIPIVGSNVLSTAAQNLPFVKTVAVLAREIAAEPIRGRASEAWLKDVKTLAEVGAAPSRYAKETFSTKLAEQMGSEPISLKKATHILSPMISGPKGMDMRARVVALRALREAKPDASPAEIRDFVNHAVGRYATELEPTIIRKMKEWNVAPFATAGRTFISSGIQRVAHPFGGESLNAVPTGAQRATVAALNFARSPWAIPILYSALYKAYRGKDWWDEGSKFGTIPLKDEDKKSPLAVAMGLDDKGSAVNVLDFFFPVERRGMRTTGMDALINGLAKGKDFGSMMRDAGLQAANTFAAPLEGPVVRFGTRLGYGAEPYVVHDDRTGEYGLMKREPYGTPGGAAGTWERAKLALEGMNPTYKALTEDKRSTTEYLTDTALPRATFRKMPPREKYQRNWLDTRPAH